MSKIQRANRAILLSVMLGASVIMLSMISGCGSTGEVQVSVTAHENMNNKHAARMVFYQLRSSTNFEMLPPESFWKDGESVFSADLAAPKIEIMLYPGEVAPWVPLLVSKDTQFIGVAVDFREPGSKGWRMVYPLAGKRPKEILLTVVDNRIEIRKK